MCCSRLTAITGCKKVAKNRHLSTITQLYRVYLRNYGTYRQSEKNLLSSNISSTCPHNMVNFGHQRLRSFRQFGAPQLISTGFASWQPYCTALQQWASAKLRRSTDGATYIRQGGHRVGHWPTFLVCSYFSAFYTVEFQANSSTFQEVTKSFTFDSTGYFNHNTFFGPAPPECAGAVSSALHTPSWIYVEGQKEGRKYGRGMEEINGSRRMK